MSEENEQIAEESVQVQPAAESPEGQAAREMASEPPKAGKARKKGKRAVSPEPEPVAEEIPVSESATEPSAGEEAAPERAEEPAEEISAPPASEGSELPAESDSTDPAEPEPAAEASQGRTSRKKGKRSAPSGEAAEPAVASEDAPEGASESAASGESVEGFSEESEPAEPADEGTRHVLPLVVEAILFASQKPMSAKELLSVFKGAADAVKEIPDAPARAYAKIKEPHLREAIESLEIACAAPDRAYEVRESAAGWQLVTKPQYSPWLRQLFPEHRSARLSAPAMETLAIIAYRQPITRADIEAVRGVAVDGVMQTLLDRGLVKIAGRADVPGRPLLYDTTQNFMEHFGLKNLDDLPNAAELRKISLPTAEPPPADPPAATGTAAAPDPTVAPASPDAPAEAATDTPAEPAAESAGTPEEAPAEIAAPTEAAEETPPEASEPEPLAEISETSLSPEASEEESRPEN